MIVSVTPLGSRGNAAAGAVARVVDYLDGRSVQRPGRSDEWWERQSLADKAPSGNGLERSRQGAVAYYADSVEGPGRWMGRGLCGFAPHGEVRRDELERMLLGCHPATGRRLLKASGSAERVRLHEAETSATHTGHADELLTLAQAARQLGVSARYLRTLAAETAVARAAEHATTPRAAPVPLTGPYLDAVQGGPGAHWRVSRAEVARFAAARKPPAAVIGYDLTFSVPKSVSLLWAWADPERQAEIVAAVHDAVVAGVAYLEDHAAFVRTAPGAGPIQPTSCCPTRATTRLLEQLTAFADYTCGLLDLFVNDGREALTDRANYLLGARP